MAANARRVQVSADNLANVTTPGYAPKEVVATAYSTGGLRTATRSRASLSNSSLEHFSVDVSDEYARLIQARAAYQSSAEVMRTASTMLKEPIFG